MAAKANSYTRDRDLVIKTDTESEYESETEEEEDIYHLKIKPTISVQPQSAVMDKCHETKEMLGNLRKRQIDMNMNAVPAKRRQHAPKLTKSKNKNKKI